MCSDIFQELHEWILLALIILLSTYSSIQNVLKQCVTRKWWKSVFQSSKWNIQYLDKKWRKCCKSFHQGLHQHYHQHQFSNYIDKFWLVFPNSQGHINHIYKTGVSDRVSKSSLRQIHLLKSLVSFLLQSFQKKTTLVQICWPSASATYEWLREITIIDICVSGMDNKPS